MAEPLSNEQVEEAFKKSYARSDVRSRRSKEATDAAHQAMKFGKISTDQYPDRVRDHMEHNMVRDGKLPAPPTRPLTGEGGRDEVHAISYSRGRPGTPLQG